MIRSYRYRLYPTSAQERALESWLELTRELLPGVAPLLQCGVVEQRARRTPKAMRLTRKAGKWYVTFACGAVGRGDEVRQAQVDADFDAGGGIASALSSEALRRAAENAAKGAV